MGLIIHKPPGANVELFKNIATKASEFLVSSVFSVVVIKSRRRTYFYDGLIKNGEYSGITGFYTLVESDNVFLSLVTNYNDIKNVHEAHRVNLLTFSAMYSEGVKWNENGPYFILLGDFPYLIQNETKRFPYAYSKKYIEEALIDEGAYFLLRSNFYDKIHDKLDYIKKSINDVVIGDHTNQWIKNEKKYYSVDGIMVSNENWGILLEDEVIDVDPTVKKVERYQETSDYFLYRDLLASNLFNYVFYRKEKIGYTRSSDNGPFLVTEHNKVTSAVKLRSILDGRVDEVYFYDLFTNFAKYPIKQLNA